MAGHTSIAFELLYQRTSYLRDFDKRIQTLQYRSSKLWEVPKSVEEGRGGAPGASLMRKHRPGWSGKLWEAPTPVEEGRGKPLERPGSTTEILIRKHRPYWSGKLWEAPTLVWSTSKTSDALHSIPKPQSSQ